MNGRKALLDTTETCLGQKLDLFHRLKNLTEEQNEILCRDEIDLEAFEGLLEKKELHILSLAKIDDNLIETQDKYKSLLTTGLETFEDQINRIRNQLNSLDLITKELSNLENTNMKKINAFFNDKKTDIQNFRKSKNVASKYTQNMPDTHQNEMSYFMDRKK